MNKWNEYVNTNRSDEYSNACVKVAEKVMEILDHNNESLHKGYYPDINTAHGIICKADEDIGAGGISGFQAEAVEIMVKECHSRGKEFSESYKTVVPE